MKKCTSIPIAVTKISIRHLMKYRPEDECV